MTALVIGIERKGVPMSSKKPCLGLLLLLLMKIEILAVCASFTTFQNPPETEAAALEDDDLIDCAAFDDDVLIDVAAFVDFSLID